MQAANIPGLAYGVVRGGKVLHLRGFGRADPRATRVTPRTPFVLGSVSKLITATAVIQLADQGLVDLDRPVQTYLPAFGPAGHGEYGPVTVRHLLSHTSGMTPEAGLACIVGDGPETPSGWAERLGQEDLMDKPGQRFAYSNANYLVLGALIEKVSGEPYGRYLAREIFAPLQMADSFAGPSGNDEPHIATGHRWCFGLPVAARTSLVEGAAAAGYVVCSAADLSRFLAAHLNGGSLAGARLLSPVAAAAMRAPNQYNAGARYGLGWQLSIWGDESWVGHTGSLPGFYALVVAEPESGWGLVVLSNINLLSLPHPVDHIAAGIMAHLLGRPVSNTLDFRGLCLTFYTYMVALTLLVLRRLIRLPRWCHAAVAGRNASPVIWSSRTVLPLALDLLLFILIVAVGPSPLRWSPDWWRVKLAYQPDVTCWQVLSGIAAASVLLSRLLWCFCPGTGVEPGLGDRIVDGAVEDAQ